MNRRLIGWLTASAILFLTGCSSVKNPYIPAKVGPVSQGDCRQGLIVEIRPESELTKIGHPIIFQLTIKNTGDQALWVPREPPYRMHIIYPNGRRDNSLEDAVEARYYQEQDAVLLKPGQQISTRAVVKTHYFEKGGITEFYAVVHTGQNTNPELTPFWNGHARSNSYGVMIKAPWGYAVGRQIFGQVAAPQDNIL